MDRESNLAKNPQMFTTNVELQGRAFVDLAQRTQQIDGNPKRYGKFGTHKSAWTGMTCEIQAQSLARYRHCDAGLKYRGG
jgi:hypothetical protein